MPATAQPISGAPQRRRWWALAALALSALTIGLDVTILNVALPTIATELSAGTDALQWIIDAYVLVFAGLMLPAGALGDRFGHKRLLLFGLVVLGAASLVAAWASTTGVLIAARAAMGLSAAITATVTLAVLRLLFTGAEQGRAISVLVMTMGIGLPLGPIVGGYLLEHVWWGSIFLINVPLVVVATIAIGALLPKSRGRAPARADLAGGLLSTAGLVSFVYGVIEGPVRGWDDPLVLVTLSAGLALLALFVAHELRTPEPMIDLALFRRSQFLWGSLAATVVSFALFGLLFVAPQYLQFVLGFDALGTGLRLLPMIGGMVLGAPLGERLAERAGFRVPVALGLVLVAGGLAVGAATDATSGYGFIAGWLALVGLGTGTALAPAMTAILEVLPPERAGSGTAIAMTLRQAGGALGVALLGSLLSQAYADRLAASGLRSETAEAARESIAGALAAAARLGDPALAGAAKSAYVHGMSLVLVGCALVAALGALAAGAFMPGKQLPGRPRARATG